MPYDAKNAKGLWGRLSNVTRLVFSGQSGFCYLLLFPSCLPCVLDTSHRHMPTTD